MPPRFELSLDLVSLRSAYKSGTITPSVLVENVLARIADYDDPALFIHQLPKADILAYAARLELLAPDSVPLYGVPFVIKDNIDLAGIPTTAACPQFSYTPTDSAPVVAQLIAAGAIPIGKTNLDQFATGLVGVRSPYGVPRNPFHSDMIPGGSSSGSASAVAAGLVTFSLGTDTAGSGRVPASFQNLVGIKPTRGWLSTRGVVPACRSLDCVSIFALTVTDASTIAQIAAGYDPADPFSRPAPANERTTSVSSVPTNFRFGVPAADQLEWFGDTQNPALFANAVRQLEALGGTRVEIDFAPFRDAARLLYEGPWVAERWSAIREFHATHADAIFPVTRKIIEGGGRPLAVDAFEALYKLAELRRSADAAWEKIDTLVLPTAATIYTRAQLEADPITLNSRLGHYTNFANLLDTAAIAVPAGFRPDGLPFGITLFGPAWTDGRLASLANRFHHATATRMGASNAALPSPSLSPGAPTQVDEFQIAVVGAHLSGQPLNRELTERGGRLVRATHTADCYRLYALAGTTPPKPGLVRGAPGSGAPIEVEVWSLPPTAWAEFVAAIPPPLGIGTLFLTDSTRVKGFIAEPAALVGAIDITSFGGWRAYLRSRRHS